MLRKQIHDKVVIYCHILHISTCFLNEIGQLVVEIFSNNLKYKNVSTTLIHRIVLCNSGLLSVALVLVVPLLFELKNFGIEYIVEQLFYYFQLSQHHPSLSNLRIKLYIYRIPLRSICAQGAMTLLVTLSNFSGGTMKWGGTRVVLRSIVFLLALSPAELPEVRFSSLLLFDFTCLGSNMINTFRTKISITRYQQSF